MRGSRFAQPLSSLGTLDTEDASRLIEAAADVALVLDSDGTVRDLAFRDSDLEGALKGSGSWLGRKLSDMVTVESRPKAAALLDAAAKDRDPQLRHLNHAASNGSGVAVEYAAIRTRQGGPIIAFGRDLRPFAALQQRLVDAQQAISRDYAALRQAQARYRLLFDTAPEPLIVLDAQTLRITEVNDAGRDLPSGGRRIAGKPFVELFETSERGAVTRFLSAVRSAGRADTVRARLFGAAGEDGDVTLTASLLTEEEASVVIVRLLPRTAAAPDPSELSDRLLSALEQAPDAFVFTGPEGNILAVNSAFLAMAQLPSGDQARGAGLEEWVGQPGVDVPVLLANLRQRGTVRLFRTTVRGAGGLATEVEISAVSVFGAELPSYGFAIRDVGRRLEEPAAASAESNGVMPRSVEQLTELIGRVSLKDLVRDATDVIERLCIEAALELTGDNRASAAEMLGLSRQSLYVKLRRYGLGDLDDAGDEP